MRVPIRASGVIFIVFTLAIGFVMAGLFYARTKSAIIETSLRLFDRTAALMAADLTAERSQISLALAFASRSELAGARTYAERLRGVGELSEALSDHPWLIAAYVGYPDGGFLLLRRVPRQPSAFGAIPAATSFILQSIDRSGGGSHGHYTFYDARMVAIGSHDDPGYRYDPRTRPWFAAGRDTVYTTAPYIFFTTKELGITLSRRSDAGSVFGADVDLASLSAQLRRLRPTPSSVTAIVQSNGAVLAYSDPDVFSHLERGASDDRAPSLGELKSAPLSAAFASYARGGAKAQDTYSDAHGRSWLSRVLPVFGGDAKSGLLGLSVLSVPEDELLGSAAGVWDEAGVLGAITIAIFLPLLILIVARGIANPLEAVSKEMEAVRQLKFDGELRGHSRIREVHALEEGVNLMSTSLRSFAGFVPLGVIRGLVETGKPLTLSGESRFLSIVFTDLENFSTISEHLPPDDLVRQVSEYFEVVTSAVTLESGTIDKFIGDSVMAFWGAPAPVDDHVYRSCVAAVLSAYRMRRLNERWANEGRPTMNVRIGLHSDNVVVGNFGSSDRLSYTVMGDGVNVASRLEGVNKIFHTTICMSDKHYQAVADRVYARPIQYVTVKGRQGRFLCYELIGIRNTADPELVGAERAEQLCAMTVAAMERLIAEQPAEAHAKYAEILASFPADPVARHMFETNGVFS